MSTPTVLMLTEGYRVRVRVSVRVRVRVTVRFTVGGCDVYSDGVDAVCAAAII